MKKFLFFVCVSLLFVSCTESSVQSVKFGELDPGEKTQISFIESDKDSASLRVSEIQEKLPKELLGKKKLLGIKTIYKAGRLFSAEVTFTDAEKENEIKVVFVTSSERYLPSVDKDIRKKIKEEVQKDVGIVTVQSVYQSGYLVAAEIYYQ